MSLKLSSRAFSHQGAIPERHSKQGGNLSPALAWTDVPKDARSLALIVDDPDAPSGTFVHWLVYGIRPGVRDLTEGVKPEGHQGVNGFGDIGYGGPQPPSGTHRYVFHLYALDTDSDLPDGLTREELDGVIQGHIIEQAVLTGVFSQGESTRRAT